MKSLGSQADIILYSGDTLDVSDTFDPEESHLKVSDLSETEDLEAFRNLEPSLYESIVTDSLFGVTGTEERELYTIEERRILRAYDELSYDARYFLVRFVLRKWKWYRQSVLASKYRGEVGDKGLKIVAELTGQPYVEIPATEDVPEILDLTVDPSFAFCLDEHSLTLEEAFTMLDHNELKSLATAFKIKSTGPSQLIIESLLELSKNQRDISSYYTTSRSPIKSLRERMLVRILKTVGKCMKVKQEVIDLFKKAHLIFFRSTSFPDSLLLPALLASFKKRNHPQIEAIRSSMLIWPSLDVFQAYWKALAVLKQVEAALDYNDPSNKPPPTNSTTKKPFKKNRVKDEEEEEPIPEPKNHTTAKKVWNIVKTVIPEWWAMVQQKKQNEHVRGVGLERFEPGYILTRVVHKGADACGTLGRYPDEVRILHALLEQPFWRQRKRGCWFDRLALVLTKTWDKIKPNDEADDEPALQCLPVYSYTKLSQAKDLALAVLRRSLDIEHEKVGRVYIAKLVSRLEKLENQKKLPEHHRTDLTLFTKLKQASEVHIEGIRVYQDLPPPAAVDEDGQIHGNDLPNKMGGWVKRSMTEAHNKNQPKKGKSTWKGRGGRVVNVEEYVIQYYEDLGFRGLHTETRILTTLFGLIFFDILFMPIEGAFETPYQTAPLDLVEDSFYHARKGVIEERLKQIKDTATAVEILQSVDERERPQKTWCVGVNWDFCCREELIEIAKCIGGPVLSIICRLFAEDYASRTSGGPDLIVWDVRMAACRFVEVKGPGDSLMENQKVWIDALLQAGADVEVLHVLQEGEHRRNLIKSRDAKSTRGRQKRKSEPGISEEEEDNNEDVKRVKVDNDNYIPTGSTQHIHNLKTGKTTRKRPQPSRVVPLKASVREDTPVTKDDTLPPITTKMASQLSIESISDNDMTEQLMAEE